jgi:hypothetical protein
MTYGIAERYAVTRLPTPVFNTPKIANCFGGENGNTLSLDTEGLMKTVETVLFPHSKVKLLEQIAQSSIWKIETDEYNYGGDYYIDGRFIQHSDGIPPNRTTELPSLPTIIAQLDALVGTRYIWGGNWPDGIDMLTEFYPSQKPWNALDALTQDTWKLKGVDCTGLIYFVSDGNTERNSSRLVDFGHPVSINGLSLNDILSKLQDLDLIVWEGHTVCVLNQKTSIESQPLRGVVKEDLSQRLSQIMATRKPVDNWSASEGSRFVVRRWHRDNLPIEIPPPVLPPEF